MICIWVEANGTVDWGVPDVGTGLALGVSVIGATVCATDKSSENKDKLELELWIRLVALRDDSDFL